MKHIKRSVLVLLSINASLFSVFGYVDCRETISGCTGEQLVSLCYNAPTSSEDKATACRQAIIKIQEQITALTSTKGTINAPVSKENCLILAKDLWIGKKDSETNGEVTKLQKFLIEQELLQPSSQTGYYGPATADAVYRYQVNVLHWNWVSRSSGVGPKTRAMLAKNCQ